jgi:hypothetical protein
MIIETFHQGTEYSNLVYPNESGIMGKQIDCGSSGDKFGDALVIKITSKFVMEVFDTKKKYEVFSSASKYTLLTDGNLTKEELYKVFKDEMINMKTELNKIEVINSLPETTGLEPVPLAKMQGHLQTWVDLFL